MSLHWTDIRPGKNAPGPSLLSWHGVAPFQAGPPSPDDEPPGEPDRPPVKEPPPSPRERPQRKPPPPKKEPPLEDPDNPDPVEEPPGKRRTPPKPPMRAGEAVSFLVGRDRSAEGEGADGGFFHFW